MCFSPTVNETKKNIDLQAEIHFFLSSNWSTVETFKAQAMFIHKFYTTENYSICLFIGVFHEIYNYYYSIIQLCLCVCSALTEKRKKKPSLSGFSRAECQESCHCYFIAPFVPLKHILLVIFF